MFTLYWHLWFVCLYDIFPHYLTKGKILGEKNIEYKICVLSEIYLILRRVQRDIFINVHWSSCKMAVIIFIIERRTSFLK